MTIADVGCSSTRFEVNTGTWEKAVTDTRVAVFRSFSDEKLRKKNSETKIPPEPYSTVSESEYLPLTRSYIFIFDCPTMSSAGPGNWTWDRRSMPSILSHSFRNLKTL